MSAKPELLQQLLDMGFESRVAERACGVKTIVFALLL